MNILIVGLGALGTVFAAMLQKAGHHVHALTRDRYLDALRDRHVRVTGIWGEHEAVLDEIASAVDPLRGTAYDLLILTVKSYDTATAIRQVGSLVGANTLVLVAQNGYGNYEIVSEQVGKDRVLLGRIIFGAKQQGPGRSEVTVIADDVRLGQPDAAVPEPLCRKIASAIKAAGIPTEYASDITAILWDKILYNAALNPLGAILECTYGQLAEQPDARSLMDEVIEEIFAVAGANAFPLNWPDASAYRNHFYMRLVPPTAKHYPSMYYDLKAGKRTEIEALNGAVVRLAARKGLIAPVNSAITRLIGAKEALATRTHTAKH
jgi:2-dehydropantoate 2-reductase